MSTVWGLVDDRTGHTGQVLGVISKLGLPFTLKRLEYNALARLPSGLLGSSTASLGKGSASISAPFPSLVIAAGRRTIPALRYIKKHAPGTKTVYLMWPEVSAGIDLIVVPEHDKKNEGSHIITTLASLHAVTSETLVAAKAAWQQQFAHLPRPWVGLFLGGATKHGSYSPRDWRELMQRALALSGSGSLLITTSRRTPPEVYDMMGPLLQTPHLLHRWDRDKDNPYLGILANADSIIVTGDSLSMCTEACVSGKPVFVFAREQVAPPKHQRLHTALYKRGLARPLDNQAGLDWQPTAALDDVSIVAGEIKKRFGL